MASLPIARTGAGDLVANIECMPPPGELPILAGQIANVTVGGFHVHVFGDPITLHPYNCVTGDTHTPTLLSTNTTVTVGGLPIGRLGDPYFEIPDPCTGTIGTILQSTVFAGD